MTLLEKIQDEEYNALKIVLSVCRENGLKCYLRGGSALGAIKYHDFVPWDDDIDIALPRDDYLKLIEIMPYEFGDGYLFVAYQNVDNSHCYFPRVVLCEKVRQKKGYPRNNERGTVLIDILPLDGMPNNRLKLWIHVFKAYYYRVLAGLWTVEVKETVSMHGSGKDRLLNFLRFFKIHHLYKQDDIYIKLDKLYSKYPFLSTNKSGMLSSDKVEKEILPSSWWGEGTEARFRDLDVLVPSDYDCYLKRLFGDNYAVYEPPKNKRTKSHLYGKV